MFEALLAGDARVRGWLQPSGAPEVGDCDDTDLRGWVDAFLAAPPASPWNRATIAARLAEPRLALPGTALVATGQQPAVGGGPLYSLVKAAHAVALAERLTRSDRPVLPLFWCASEDHDLGECGHVDLIRRDGTVVRVAPDLGPGSSSLRWRPALGWWEAVLAGCREHLGAGLGSTWLERHAPHAGEGMGAWQCRLIAALLPGLVCVEGHHLRPLWSDAAQRSLDAWPRTALAERRAELHALGAGDPFGALDDPPWFADRSGGRVALAPADARALHGSVPDALSPGAALRPALQQAALPVAIYLGGPGEIAYHAAIAPVYAALGVPRPLLVPRCSITLLPKRIERALVHWGIDPRDVGATAPAPVLTPLGDDELSALDTAIDRVERLTLPDDARRRRDAGVVRVRREAQRLRLSLARGRRRSEDLPAYGALRAWLWPRSQRQERVLGLVPAIWEHGPGIAAVVLANARTARPGEHRHVTL